MLDKRVCQLPFIYHHISCVYRTHFTIRTCRVGQAKSVESESVFVTATVAVSVTVTGIGLWPTFEAWPFLISHFSFYISHFVAAAQIQTNAFLRQALGQVFCFFFLLCLWPKVNVCVSCALYLLVAKRKPFPWLTWLSLASRFSCLTKHAESVRSTRSPCFFLDPFYKFYFSFWSPHPHFSISSFSSSFIASPGIAQML